MSAERCSECRRIPPAHLAGCTEHLDPALRRRGPWELADPWQDDPDRNLTDTGRRVARLTRADLFDELGAIIVRLNREGEPYRYTWNGSLTVNVYRCDSGGNVVNFDVFTLESDERGRYPGDRDDVVTAIVGWHRERAFAVPDEAPDARYTVGRDVTARQLHGGI